MNASAVSADNPCGDCNDPRHQNLEHAQPYLDSVRRWAKEFDLPESLLLAVIYAESRFDPSARSGENALGLMQLIPHLAGADAWSFITGEQRIPTEAELLDPDTNIRLGAAYLRMLKDHYWSDVEDPAALRHLVLASYNWGVGNMRRRIEAAAETAPDVVQSLIEKAAPAETRGYLRIVQQRARSYEEMLMATSERLAAQ